MLVDSNGAGLAVGDIWIRGGKVIDPMELFYAEKKTADVVWECNQLIAAPGFIDLQVNGKWSLVLLNVLFPYKEKLLHLLVNDCVFGSWLCS